MSDHVRNITTVPVRTGHHAYDVLVGRGILSTLGDQLRSAGINPGSRAFIAHDAALPEDIVNIAARALTDTGFRISHASVHAAESSKTLAGAQALLVEMARTWHERGEPVIALGGGLVGDLVGFAAAVYRRGVPIVQCPTTLLAMVDAAVGGKTAVNLDVDGDLLKNLVGAFHQPLLIVADVDTLASLSARQFSSGLAECIKHGMIGAEFAEPALFEWLEAQCESILRRDPAILIELVVRNVALKAAVIASDEREERDEGGRALLNLGHTFGHAIETCPGAAPAGAPAAGLHHGEAVALGLVAAARCAEEAGICPRDLRIPERVTALAQRCGLPTRAAGLPPAEELLAKMAHDKKVKAGVLRFVLPIGPGRAALFADPPRNAILAGFHAIGAPDS